MISIENITVTFGKKEGKVSALKKISLTIKKGEFVVITGKSGCGKSTLLNVLGGILPPEDGKYYYDNLDVYSQKDKDLAAFRNKKIGFIVQHFALINELNVANNIMLPLRYRKKDEKNENADDIRLMDELGILEKKGNFPNELSGGQKQRVAIARALITDPDMIIADEPTGALDEETGHNIMDILKKINERGKTVVMVTHDGELAQEGNRRVIMKDGEIADIIKQG